MEPIRRDAGEETGGFFPSQWKFPAGPVIDMFYILLHDLPVGLSRKDLTLHILGAFPSDRVSSRQRQRQQTAPEVDSGRFLVVNVHERRAWVQIWQHACFCTIMKYLEGDGKRVKGEDLNIIGTNEHDSIDLPIPEGDVMFEFPQHFDMYDKAGGMKVLECFQNGQQTPLYDGTPHGRCEHIVVEGMADAQGHAARVCFRCDEAVRGWRAVVYDALMERRGRRPAGHLLCTRHGWPGCMLCDPPPGYGRPCRLLESWGEVTRWG